MTQAEPSRLDRIEATLEQIAERQKVTERITQSNARAIQAWESRMEEERARDRPCADDLHDYVRSLTFRALKNLAQHEDFKDAMREFRQAMADFRRWLQRIDGNGPGDGQE